MRVLIASVSNNPVIDELAESLSGEEPVTAVTVGCEPFWSALDHSFDIIHIHWPEALFAWREPDRRALSRLSDRLRWWRERVPIVATVHNLQPHGRKRQVTYGPAYELLYREADGIIHLGTASVAPTQAIYPTLRNVPSTIIPLKLYSSFSTHMTRQEARAQLGMDVDDPIALCFGKLRRLNEVRLVLTAFRHARIPAKRLLIAGNVSNEIPRVEKIAMKTVIRLVKRATGHLHFVPAHLVASYFKAADFVVIPRIDTLNSANVVLGYSLERVVVGPDAGVTGELLMEAGNPVYRAGNFRSFAEAMERGWELSATDKGRSNRKHAEERWSGERVAALHVDFFQRLLSDQNRPTLRVMQPG